MASGGLGRTYSRHTIEMRSSDGGDDPKNPENATDDELSDLFNQPKEILTKICNYGQLVRCIQQLDPRAFLELASTCRDLYHFCLNAKGIDVVVFMEKVSLEEDEDGFYDGTSPTKYKFHYPRPSGSLYNKGSFQKQNFLKKLQKWPFSIHIGEVTLGQTGIDWNDLELEVKHLLGKNGVKKIRKLNNVSIPETLEEVKIMKDFSKIFGVETIIFEDNGTYMLDEVMEACLRLPLKALNIFKISGDLDVNFLREFTISHLTTSLSIKLAGMEEIVQIWKTRKGLGQWSFSIDPVNPADFSQFFNRYEVLPFDHPGPIDRSRAPPVFKKVYADSHDTMISFYILREDGKVFSVNHRLFFYGEYFVVFHMCPIGQHPLALQDL